jgi:hypothetical protein
MAAYVQIPKYFVIDLEYDDGVDTIIMLSTDEKTAFSRVKYIYMEAKSMKVVRTVGLHDLNK